jgi:hypothetical protein
MQNPNLIKFVRTTHRQYFEVTVNGFRVGALFTNGRVVNGSGHILGYDPVTGLSKLLGLSLTETTEVFMRESLRAMQEEGKL